MLILFLPDVRSHRFVRKNLLELRIDLIFISRGRHGENSIQKAHFLLLEY